ncbi:MAG: DUF3306 domain-containing protein [Alphaproteobacteria bacterium]|nr:DUF3306 domain-containing protein [Alphaproteobacteria bacterium]MBU0799030.1 DUF3306 domain-containing protein [Alphaproteobacteria bacterium]MBU0889260.1 DUF3306 domain-containing protein [Alphaproteobacteria bacterium]MBU1815076.1 DUF3306 domain-containing protein [Alphaproteobacteria bacterium]MBU2091138.1 DUF3306 domain-containing protein [Alphaproteobacteria bacterium]
MSDGNFLGRWARLKQQSRQPGQRRAGAAPILPAEEADPTAALTPVEPAVERPVERAADAPDQPPESGGLDLSKLPDIDTLTANSDFSVFMNKGVPGSLRRRALRKLWKSDPIFAFQDGLTDYQEDYTDAATVIEGMKTSYKVGRGFLTDLEIAENDAVYNATRRPPPVEAEEEGETEAIETVEAEAEESTEEPAGADAGEPVAIAQSEGVEEELPLEEEKTEAAPVKNVNDNQS